MYPFDIVLTHLPHKNISLPALCNPIIINKYKRLFINILKYFIPFDLFFRNYRIIITDTTSPFTANKTTKVFTVVHDLMTITNKNYYAIKSRIWFYFAVKSLKRANMIIAVSKTTKDQIHGLLKIDEDNIIVIPNVTDFTIERGPISDYFIYIGDMRKNKNLFNTILGFIEYKKKTREETKLIICGNKKNEYDDLYDLVCKRGMGVDILFPGYITDSEKIQYFKNARGLILISENEGFGIPVIEALCNNIPVLVSDIPVMHEVASGLGIFVKYDNLEEIANGFNQLLHFQITDEFMDKCEKIKNYYSFDILKTKINELISNYL
jgi:glycosyltransferase involved in cell wall biosynthesis